MHSSHTVLAAQPTIWSVVLQCLTAAARRAKATVPTHLLPMLPSSMNRTRITHTRKRMLMPTGQHSSSTPAHPATPAPARASRTAPAVMQQAVRPRVQGSTAAAPSSCSASCTRQRVCTRTCSPWRGPSVMPVTVASGTCTPGASVKRYLWYSRTSAIRASCSANFQPMHMRGPPPNGINAAGWVGASGDPGSQRSGRNSRARGQMPGSMWLAYSDTRKCTWGGTV
mmetsp:Transcript_32517/g.82609  ORF Transcript_32517/g.82609 Transcript_32517/m.82609 type:complete len:226 (-) Transcript_32517:363-1040(-)